MKVFVKILKRVGIVLGVLVILLVGTKLVLDKKLPQGTPGEEAEALAQKMLKAIDHKAWLKTGAVAWKYAGRNEHIWDKKRHLAYVKWGNNEAYIDCASGKGIALENGEVVSDTENKEAICSRAHFLWANDSYWLNPVSKIYDSGVSRAKVEHPDGDALLVSYSSGGFTPGDSYLWILDENGLPKEWQMWVEILPINGLSASWEGWTTTATGVQISTKHGLGPMTVEVTDLSTASRLKDLTDGEDIFKDLEDYLKS